MKMPKKRTANANTQRWKDG